ncbi:MAG: hypothetical protein PF574_07705 [Candidatus Delongbacteria bacterium]|jgi:predicted negative regulator of RcsB-dependent stress response|nr:hypothetical protein [Candidatus Delongbacteria bacterium]
MAIDFKRKAENEEMEKTFDFLQKNKNMIYTLIASIAVIIILVNVYKSNEAKTKVIASDKLYEINKAFQDKEYVKVIELGPNYLEKYSGYGAAGDIMIITAQAFVKEGKSDKAISLLEKHMGSNTVYGPTEFAANNILGGLYMDKWLETKDSKLADKAGKYYNNAAISDDGFHKDKSLYLAADSYSKAGNITKAKELLKPLYENSKDIDYQLKQKINFLYEGLD